MNAIAPTTIVGAFANNRSASLSGNGESLHFALSYDDCALMVRNVLRDLGAHTTTFGDKTLCTLREAELTYAFELEIERKSTGLSKVILTNFKALHSFTELIAMRHKLVATEESDSQN